MFGQAGCSSRVFAEHPRNRVFEVDEQGVCGVFEVDEQGVCGVFGTPRKQGVCFCPKSDIQLTAAPSTLTGLIKNEFGVF